MRKIIVSAALLCAGLGVAAPAAATGTDASAFGPPPKCIAQSQSRFVGLEVESWTYLRTEGNKLFFDYRFNSFEYGEVSCTA